MQRTTYSLVLAFMLASIAQAADGQQATIVDVGGTETKLVDLTTDQDEFFGFAMGSSGIPIVIKDFRVRQAGGADYRRWLYLDEVEHLELKQGTVSARLKTGATVSASFGSVNPVYVQFRGKSEFGDLSLPSYKVRSITVAGGNSGQQHPNVMGTEGPKATITLRDGTVLTAAAVQRHVFFFSRYINVRGTHAHYSSVWIAYKRGEASVETELVFSRIKDITFDTPVVTSEGYSGGTTCKVSLRDGSILSGECRGGERAREFNSLVGRTDAGPFGIAGDLGYAIKTIQFSEYE